MTSIIKNIKLSNLFTDCNTGINYLAVVCDEKNLEPRFEGENLDEILENGLVISLDTLDKMMKLHDYIDLAFSNCSYELKVELGNSIFPSDAFTWQEITSIISIKRL